MADFLAGPITDPLPQRLTPASVSLVDGANIALDASQGDVFIVTLGGNRTLSAPTNPKGGQRFTLIVKQDGTGGRKLSFDAAYTGISGASVAKAISAVSSFQFVTVVSSAGAYTHQCIGIANGTAASGKVTVANGASSATVDLGDATLTGNGVVCSFISDGTAALTSALGIPVANVAAGVLTIKLLNPATNAAVTASPAAGVVVGYCVSPN